MLDIQKFLGKPQIKVLQEGNVTKFTYWPLPAGIGHSLWNLLRRTILAYNPAISVTGLKIAGVPHEYYTVDGLKESILQVMLNFKDLRFYGDLPENPLWVTKKFKGIGKYTVKDLDLPAGVEILTDDAYLFEITDPNLELEISYRLEKWYRYLSLTELKKREDEQKESEAGSDVGLLLIDNDFKIVKSVSYTVEEVMEDFTAEPNDYIELKIEPISTKVNPKDLVSFAAEVSISYLKMFIFPDSYIDESLLIDVDELEDTSAKEVEIQEIKKTPIDSLTWLSERSRNALIKNNIEFVEDLVKLTKSELLSMKGVGKKAIDEIEAALEREGKSLGSK